MRTESWWPVRLALLMAMAMVPSAAAEAQAVVGSISTEASIVQGFGYAGLRVEAREQIMSMFTMRVGLVIR